MSYRMVYFRISSSGYTSGWSSDQEKNAFREESRRMFKELGWDVHKEKMGGIDKAVRNPQELYLHPDCFSGVVDEAGIQSLQEHLAKAQTFRCYAVDQCEEYADMSDAEYRAALEARREEITAAILERYRTKKPGSYILRIVANPIDKQFEILRLCDKTRRNSVGKSFVIELINQLIQEGRMICAKTPEGPGIRTATEEELSERLQPVEQAGGQLAGCNTPFPPQQEMGPQML